MSTRPYGMTDLEVKQGDTAPTLSYALTDRDDAAIDVSSTNRVSFYMEHRESGTNRIVDDAANVSVADAATGEVEYQFDNNDFSSRGLHIAEFEVEYSNGLVERVPTGTTYIEIRVGEAIATSTASEVEDDTLTLTSLSATNVDLVDGESDPASTGEIRVNGQDVKAYSGGAVVNLSDIGTGSGTYTDEDAQDAVGTGFDATLTYDDAAAAFGVATNGIGPAQLAAQAVTTSKIDGSGGNAGSFLTTDGSAGGVSWSGTGTYTDEEAQDAVGLNFDGTLAYDDAAPSFGIASGGVDTGQLASEAVTTAEVDGSGGSNGQFLTTDGTSGGVSWGSVSASASSWTTRPVTTDVSAANNDEVLADSSSGPVNVTLPSPSTGVRVRVMRVASENAVTVARAGAEDINRSASDLSLADLESVELVSDGTDWWVI